MVPEKSSSSCCWIQDLKEEIHEQDGLYFSDDGGDTFVKVFDFKSELWCKQYGQFPPLEIDKLASEHGLDLTETFIIRFQQHDDQDFSGSNSIDGFYIDDLHVYRNDRSYATLPYFNDFESGEMGDFLTKQVAFNPSLPIEGFTLPGGIVEVADSIGFQSLRALQIGGACDGEFATNALDLQLNLADETDVEMTFRIMDLKEETHSQDGIYFSDDGGVNFVKVYDFKPELWCEIYGQFPAFDVDQLAFENDLELTQNFIIRFQQHDDQDFNGSNTVDGFFIDDLHVYSNVKGYASIPYIQNFEDGQLGDFLTPTFAGVTALPVEDATLPTGLIEVADSIGFDSYRAVRMGKICDDGFATNALDLRVNLAGQENILLQFDLLNFSDESHPQDGLFFSNDGGQNFSKVASFDFDFIPDNVYLPIQLNLDSLASVGGVSFSEKFIIRFQQHGEKDFSGTQTIDGCYIDNIWVVEMISNSNDPNLIEPQISVIPNPASTQFSISYNTDFEIPYFVDIYNSNGQYITQIIQDNNEPIDISAYQSGLYFLKIWKEESVIFKKLVKQ